MIDTGLALSKVDAYSAAASAEAMDKTKSSPQCHLRCWRSCHSFLGGESGHIALLVGACSCSLGMGIPRPLGMALKHGALGLD